MAGFGYARVPSGRETCGWCYMLASLGFAYGSAEAAARGSHEGCDCAVVSRPKGSGVEFEGYDPGLMARRWASCRATVDNASLRAASWAKWDAMGASERAKWSRAHDPKDLAGLSPERLRELGLGLGADTVPFERFHARQVMRATMREVETRDTGWLYDGREPVVEYESERARHELSSSEMDTLRVVRSNGFAQKILERSNAAGVKTADLILGDSIKADYKTPLGLGFNCIDRLMRDAGKKADVAIVHLRKETSVMSLDDAMGFFSRCGMRRGVSEALFIDYDESIHRVKI